jgi:glucose-6-phosphate isomerase
MVLSPGVLIENIGGRYSVTSHHGILLAMLSITKVMKQSISKAWRKDQGEFMHVIKRH